MAIIDNKSKPVCRVYLVNTETAFFCDPSDYASPATLHPVVNATDTVDIAFRFVDRNGAAYPFTSVDDMVCIVTIDGGVVWECSGKRFDITRGLDGVVRMLLKRPPNTVLPTSGTAQITFSLDGQVLLDDTITIAEVPVVKVQSEEEDSDGLKILSEYKAPSPGMINRYILYLGPTGLLNQGDYYQCALVNDEYTWINKTPEWVNVMRWREWE